MLKMLMQKTLSHYCKTAVSRRFINVSSKNFESKISDTTKVSSSASTSSSADGSISKSVLGARMKAPTDFEKWILVWMKKYPKGQVPDRVKEEVVYQTKSRARIKVANYMMVFTAILCIGAIINGKNAKKEGDSLQQRNIQWHKKINEEHKAQLEVKT